VSDDDTACLGLFGLVVTHFFFFFLTFFFTEDPLLFYDCLAHKDDQPILFSMVRKAIDSRIHTLVKNGVQKNHRTFFVLVGDRGRDQASILVNLRVTLFLY
jgi:hypothetical protein